MAKLANVSRVASKVRKNVSSSLSIKNFDIKWILIAILVGIVIFIVVKFIKNSTRSFERFQDTCPPPSVTKDQYYGKLADYVSYKLWNVKRNLNNGEAEEQGNAVANLLGLPYSSIKQDLNNVVNNILIKDLDVYVPSISGGGGKGGGGKGVGKGGENTIQDVIYIVKNTVTFNGDRTNLENSSTYIQEANQLINVVWNKYLQKEAELCAAMNTPPAPAPAPYYEPASESSDECPTMDEESCRPFISPLKSKLTEANNQIANESNCASYVTASSCNQFISPIESQLAAANAERASDATCIPYINEASCRNYIDPIKNDLEARLRVSLSKEANATTCAPFITIAPPPPPKKSPPPPPKKSSPPPPKRSSPPRKR